MKDPRWIGAWWIGFMVLGIAIILISLPMFFFPREFRQINPQILAKKKIQTNRMSKFISVLIFVKCMADIAIIRFAG